MRMVGFSSQSSRYRQHSINICHYCEVFVSILSRFGCKLLEIKGGVWKLFCCIINVPSNTKTHQKLILLVQLRAHICHEADFPHLTKHTWAFRIEGKKTLHILLVLSKHSADCSAVSSEGENRIGSRSLLGCQTVGSERECQSWQLTNNKIVPK